MGESHDVVIIGSGIAGSSLALVLQKAGIQTFVVERKTHPRFVIGESTIPATSFLLNQLAVDYDVPELAQVSHYLGLRERGCAAWPKQGLWYGWHAAGSPLEAQNEGMFDGLPLPIGPDVHMLRADADAFLVSRFPSYGVDYEDDTEVVGFESDASGVSLRLKGPKGVYVVKARLVVDCSGHASFLANRFGLRDATPRLHTNTRSLFAHFKNVPPLDELLGGCNPAFRYRRDSATMHHFFPGGWVWVIPFDSGITSVGVQFDQNIYPLDESIAPEEELARFLARYPTIKAHLGAMEPVRPLIRTDRLQFTASSILGDGFILAPHAAAFIEPLFSTGISLTASFISRFVPTAQMAKQDNDWGIERFRPLEMAFFTEVEQIDWLVDSVIQAFRSYDLFKQCWRNWVIATVTEVATCVLVGRAPRTRPMIYGSGIEGFRQHLRLLQQEMRRADRRNDDLALAAEFKRRTDPWWDLLTQPALFLDGDWSVGSGCSTGVHGYIEKLVEWLKRLSLNLSVYEPEANFENAQRWLSNTGKKRQVQAERYWRSVSEGGDYHRAYERILENQNPARFD